MKEIKDTVRSHVRVAYDGSVHKTFRGTHARERFLNEARVLKYLEQKNCDFVPRVIETNEETLCLVTTNCGSPVTNISEEKMKRLFGELLTLGVRHGDEFMRNITYDSRKGRFCVIDFELAEIFEPAEPQDGPPPDSPAVAGDQAEGAQAAGAQAAGAQVDGAQVDGAQVDGAQAAGAQVDGVQAAGAQVDGVQPNTSQVDGASGQAGTEAGDAR